MGSKTLYSYILGGIILTCYIKSAAIILQSMGNSVKSTVLALLRDVIIFVPASIIIAIWFEVLLSITEPYLSFTAFLRIIYINERNYIKQLERKLIICRI